MKEKLIETFNNLSADYEHSVDHESVYNSEYERPAMLAELPERMEGLRVLDAGCAAGWYTQELLERGATVTAIDVSPEMVRSAIRRTGGGAEVLCVDLEGELPFEDASFNLVLSSLTLHYLKDWSKTFEEFNRILKPGGILLFSVHHPFTDIKLLEEAHYFSTELIIDKWKKSGKIHDVPFYRRPLNEIFAKTLEHFSIKEVIEPKPTQRFKELAPERYERLMAEPNFLIIKAVSD